jgi:hypothetical protein
MARTKLEIQTPTAYNFLRIVNVDMTRRYLQRIPVEVTVPPLLVRAQLITEETEMLTTETTPVDFSTDVT